MLIIFSPWFVLHYAGDTARENNVWCSCICKHNLCAYAQKHAWMGTYIPHTQSRILKHTPYTFAKEMTNSTMHTHAYLLRRVSQGLIWWQASLAYCWNILSINKCSIINKPQNGSNCSLPPNASISIPRTFVEQPVLFLITASYLGRKRAAECWIFPVLLGFRGQTSGKNPQRCGVVITIWAKLPLIFNLYFYWIQLEVVFNVHTEVQIRGRAWLEEVGDNVKVTSHFCRTHIICIL